MFTVKQVSEILGITPHALRFYDKEGLLPGLSRRNNQRFFSYDDIEWLRYIKCWRKTGMTVADVKRYHELFLQGDSTFAERFKMVQAQREKAKRDVKEAKERLKLIEWKLRRYEALAKGEEMAPWLPDIQKIVAQALRKKKRKTGNQAKRKADVPDISDCSQ